MLSTFIAALALAATVAASGAAFAQDVSMYTTSQSAALNAPSAFDGLHSDGTAGRAYVNGQKTN